MPLSLQITYTFSRLYNCAAGVAQLGSFISYDYLLSSLVTLKEKYRDDLSSYRNIGGIGTFIINDSINFDFLVGVYGCDNGVLVNHVVIYNTSL